MPSLSLLSVCTVLGTPCSFDLGMATELFRYLGNCKAKGSQQTGPARLLAAGGCALTGVLESHFLLSPLSGQLRDNGHCKEAWEQGVSHLGYEEAPLWSVCLCVCVCVFAETPSFG